jgi:hypothetical protein
LKGQGPEKKAAGRLYWKFAAVVIGLTGITNFVSAMASETYADKLASWFSSKHVIVAHPVHFGYKAFPNCTVVEVSFIPRQNITHLDVDLMFDEEISSKLVRQVPLSDYSGKHGSNVKGDVSLKPPCEFNEETETPNSNDFSVNLSTDRKTVFTILILRILVKYFGCFILTMLWTNIGRRII